MGRCFRRLCQLFTDLFVDDVGKQARIGKNDQIGNRSNRLSLCPVNSEVMKKRSILFLVPLPHGKAPSQRFRLELYETYLREAGIEYCMKPFLDQGAADNLYKKGAVVLKLSGLIRGFLRRIFLLLFTIHKFEFVYVMRQASPIGPPIFEWMVAKLWRKKMIYDFDDALWIPRTSKENKLAAWLKCSWKVRYIIRWSYKVNAGNEFLANYARQFNSNVEIIPTCVDTDRHHSLVKQHHDGKPVIGWTGSHSTLEFLLPVIPILEILEEQYDFSFLVICNKKPDLNLRDWKYLEWNEESEVDDLLKMDIGIMPLPDSPWTAGKCGFKIIQYLSLGIPAIASPVGVNSSIIDQGVNGFLCSTRAEWLESMAILLQNPALRSQMGLAGRDTIKSRYSILSNYPRFLQLFS